MTQLGFQFKGERRKAERHKDDFERRYRREQFREIRAAMRSLYRERVMTMGQSLAYVCSDDVRYYMREHDIVFPNNNVLGGIFSRDPLAYAVGSTESHFPGRHNSLIRKWAYREAAA